jgi:hypothetical protein
MLKLERGLHANLATKRRAADRFRLSMGDHAILEGATGTMRKCGKRFEGERAVQLRN